MSDSEIVSRFERLGYKVSIDQIAFTTESVEDFYNARETLWSGIIFHKSTVGDGRNAVVTLTPRGAFVSSVKGPPTGGVKKNHAPYPD